MNDILKPSLQKTYEFMQKHRNKDIKPYSDLRRCNKCGEYFNIEDTKMVKYKNRSYRLCYKCRGNE